MLRKIKLPKKLKSYFFVTFLSILVFTFFACGGGGGSSDVGMVDNSSVPAVSSNTTGNSGSGYTSGTSNNDSTTSKAYPSSIPIKFKLSSDFPNEFITPLQSAIASINTSFYEYIISNEARQELQKKGIGPASFKIIELDLSSRVTPMTGPASGESKMKSNDGVNGIYWDTVTIKFMYAEAINFINIDKGKIIESDLFIYAGYKYPHDVADPVLLPMSMPRDGGLDHSTLEEKVGLWEIEDNFWHLGIQLPQSFSEILSNGGLDPMTFNGFRATITGQNYDIDNSVKVGFDFETLCLHELGHVLGLDHFKPELITVNLPEGSATIDRYGNSVMSYNFPTNAEPYLRNYSAYDIDAFKTLVYNGKSTSYWTANQ